MGLKVLYGFVFAVVLPIALVAWARALEGQFPLPAYRWPWAGALLTVVGALMWVGGVVQIVRRGEGLPMNAFPPSRLVTSGAYALVAHPIYLGWVMGCAGVSLMSGSAAGLWVVTPVVALACAALVIGFERPDLRRRFGEGVRRYKPWLSLPADDTAQPTWRDALATWLTVLLPWLIAYDAVKALGVPADAIDIRIEAERDWPVWLWTVPVYASIYAVALTAPFLVPTRARLRMACVQGLVATVVISIVYLVVPIVAPFRPFEATGLFGGMLAVDQYYASPPMAAWPSFHAIWAFFIAEAVGARSRTWAIAAWVWAIAVAVSCVTTGMHAIADIPSAVVFYLLLRRPRALWRAVLDGAERLANAWHARRFGPLRVINHGVFAGLAASVGLLGMVSLAGVETLPAFLVLAALVLAGAGLWSQWIEGSSSLQRPFGYFGGIIGGFGGVLVAAWIGQPAPVVMAAAATMTPWIQAMGRLRCLVQGCCHGAPVEPAFGIRVVNSHSRVVSIGRLDGQSLHPTQVYSIASNIVIGVLLWRLWQLQAPVWFVTGSYLLMAGLARFMEEGYRGEPQTPKWLRLPIYQPLAIASVLVGAALTTLGGSPAPVPHWPLGPVLLAAALVTGVVYWFAMGVDFPESTRRYARLSG